MTCAEAAAYAAERGCRLPTDDEWEQAKDLVKWGDVWEWTATVEDGLPVVRGGCWNNRPHLERVAFRLRDDPDDRINNLGFRFAREVA